MESILRDEEVLLFEAGISIGAQTHRGDPPSAAAEPTEAVSLSLFGNMNRKLGPSVRTFCLQEEKLQVLKPL